MFEKLKQKTIGAFSHVLEKYMTKGYWPVGFSVVLYNKDASPEKKWRYDSRNLIDTHNMPDLHEKKLRERINLINEFLAEGIKRILEGELDELLESEKDIEGVYFHVPGVRGKV